MNKALFAFLSLCVICNASTAQDPQRQAELSSYADIANYSGTASGLYIISTGHRYVKCDPCGADSVRDAAGRKWRKSEDSTHGYTQRLNALQNVGINTTDPLYTLDVNGDINATGNILLNGTPISAAESFSDQGDTVSFTIANSPAKYIRVKVDPFVPITELTITMPATPVNGQRVCITAGGHLTAPSAIAVGILNIAANTGQEVIGVRNFYSFEVDQNSLCWEFDSVNQKWYVIR